MSKDNLPASMAQWASRIAQSCAACVCVVMLISATPARAELTWNFAYSGVGGNGDNIASGQLFTSDLDAGVYTILGISGTIDGFPIAGIAAAGAYGGVPTDNELFASGPQLDAGGFLIEPGQGPNLDVAHASEQIQLDTSLSTPGHPVYDASLPGLEVFSTGSFSAYQVAEPPALAMLATGLLGFAMMRRRAAAPRRRR